jgi:hypothetical protein
MGAKAYVVLRGRVQVVVIDEDNQEVAVQAPIIMMSQNRQDAKDRLRSELDFDDLHEALSKR